MDRARTQTDKKLDMIEREIGRVYKEYPALLAIEKEYAKYMAKVQKQTEKEYNAYKEDPEQKQAYIDKVKALTLGSKEYARLTQKIARVLAEVNQQALEISNNAMLEVYAMNYNQVADDCRKAGIKVDGEE
jgi:N-acetylglucosamine kinase-like BadF-type ATPase